MFKRLLKICGALVLTLLLATLGLSLPPKTYKGTFHPVKDIQLIAHAGGGLAQGAYSNSREALDQSAKNGFSWIEVDFNWTKDNELVLTRDWDRRYYQHFTPLPSLPKAISKRLPRQPATAQEFSKRRMNGGLTPMTAADLYSWMRAHPDIHIITDVKDNNIDALKAIAQSAPDLQGRFIVQIYYPEEYKAASDMGYAQIVFTNYIAKLSFEQLAQLANDYKLRAITLPVKKLTQSDIETLKTAQTPIWVHTINGVAKAQDLKGFGVEAIFTDNLIPAQSAEMASL